VAEPTLAIGAAGRPFPGEKVSGDGWSIDWHESTCRIALIDGLGHGAEAAEVTLAATTTLAGRPELAPADALRLCHQALRGTRGAVISIAQIDLARARLTYAGVGNVEARLWQPPERQRPIAYRGIVGVILPTLRSFELQLRANWILVLHTDGVTSRFELEELAPLVCGDPQLLADEILRCWGRQTDDATVIIARASG
jgi:serine phosphatase RsbU (regulator of sigma subunit)